MANFEKILPFVLKMEGVDIYTDDPLDRGGATKFGISIRFAVDTNDLDLFDIDGDGEITANDIKLLTKDKA